MLAAVVDRLQFVALRVGTGLLEQLASQGKIAEQACHLSLHKLSLCALFDLQAALAARFRKPARVANDADVQGAAVVRGLGLELVVTLGTGMGSAFFYDGRLLPHLELAHHPFRKDETYNEQLGERARKDIGSSRWNKRVRKALDTLRALCFFDHCFVGGGNAKRLEIDLPPDVTVVDNTAGLLGGIKLWEGGHLGMSE